MTNVPNAHLILESRSDPLRTMYKKNTQKKIVSASHFKNNRRKEKIPRQGGVCQALQTSHFDELARTIPAHVATMVSVDFVWRSRACRRWRMTSGLMPPFRRRGWMLAVARGDSVRHLGETSFCSGQGTGQAKHSTISEENFPRKQQDTKQNICRYICRQHNFKCVPTKRRRF